MDPKDDEQVFVSTVVAVQATGVYVVSGPPWFYASSLFEDIGPNGIDVWKALQAHHANKGNIRGSSANEAVNQ